MSVVNTPNMGLETPVLHVTQDPVWSQELLADLGILDSHDHASSSGVQIPTIGININSDLPFNSVNSILARSFRYINQNAVLSSSGDIRSTYVKSGDLWYNPSASVHVQVTSGGSVNVAGVGGFQGDYITQLATAFFSNSQNLFYYTNSLGTYSNFQIADLYLTNSSNYTVELIPAAATYTLTFPAGLPPSGATILTIDTSGLLGFGYGNNTTIGIVSNLIEVLPNSITSTQIANNTITTNQISNNANIPNSKLAPTNYSISSTFSANAPTAGVPVTLLGSPLSFTASGNRLIEISLVPGLGFGPSSISITTSQTTYTSISYQLQANFEIFVDGVSTNELILLTTPPMLSTTSPSVSQTSSQYSLDTVLGIVSLSAGTHVVNVNMTLLLPLGAPLTGIASVNAARLLVNEI